MDSARLRRLIAIRELLDAEIETIHKELGLTGNSLPGDCTHPENNRVSLATLGDTPGHEPWMCTLCGFVNEGT